ncbi:MAG TPA: DNA lyase [Bacteroidota bacterium]|nr:DNA lyase [Bacteroidota bacterium]
MKKVAKRSVKKRRAEPLSRERISELHREHRGRIRARLQEFAAVPADEYFYECVYCLMTPQSSAVNASKAEHVLRQLDFRNTAIDPEPILHSEDYYIRFHKTKTKHLLAFKENYSSILHELTNGNSDIELREWLVRNVKGLGWKEASHFLRNIGRRDLAILDRHILRNLARAGILKGLPPTLTAKQYLAIEKKFLAFAEAIGIPMDELDLLFWSMETGEIRK